MKQKQIFQIGNKSYPYVEYSVDELMQHLVIIMPTNKADDLKRLAIICSATSQDCDYYTNLKIHVVFHDSVFPCHIVDCYELENKTKTVCVFEYSSKFEITANKKNIPSSISRKLIDNLFNYEN